jgi:NAD(P)-dependent dehydrogenase (short-subunit alcohol dehydrogenase family)
MSDPSSSSKPVWFITGCSTGFGRELALHTLSLGYPTVVTARKPEQVADIAKTAPDLALVLELDVTKPEQVTSAIKATEEKFGHIDVLVNNAGIGYFGSFEESELDQVNTMFAINVWGLVSATRAVLPGMRKRRSGAIVNISSIGGLTAFPTFSFYHGTKFAVEGMSESLAQEVGPLGIKVLLVEPGPFRTDWAGRSANEAPRTISDYDETSGKRTQTTRGYSGKQPGDPARAAKAIVDAVESPNAPLHLVLGKIALNAARAKVTALTRDLDAWARVSEDADFPEGQ